MEYTREGYRERSFFPGQLQHIFSLFPCCLTQLPLCQSQLLSFLQFPYSSASLGFQLFHSSWAHPALSLFLALQQCIAPSFSLCHLERILEDFISKIELIVPYEFPDFSEMLPTRPNLSSYPSCMCQCFLDCALDFSYMFPWSVEYFPCSSLHFPS